MKIVLCFDEGYAPHAATLMEGLLDQSSVPLGFAILYVSLSGEVMGKLTHHFSTRVESLDFHRVGPELIGKVAGTKMMPHLSLETYLRLFAPLFVKDRWALYLDIDILPQGDIARIMEEATQDYPLYAVREYDATHTSLKRDNRIDAYFESLRRRLEMSAPMNYFSAGIMVLNLDRWREERLTSRLMEYIASTRHLHAADQDALNHLIDGNFGVLHPRWNSAGTFHGQISGYSQEQIADALANPAMIHFLGPKRKQWNYIEQSKLTRPYWKYRMRTPWPAAKPADRTLKNVLWRAYRRYTPRFVLNTGRALLCRLTPNKEP